MNDTRALISAARDLLTAGRPDAGPSADDVCDAVWLAARLPGTNLFTGPRWPDAAFVIDNAPSMAMWHDDLQGLHSLLGQLGAFRHLRRWLLESGAGERPQVHAGRGGLADAVTALRDPTGRRLAVVVTDGI